MEPRITLVAATAMEMRAVLQGLGMNKAAPEPGAAVTGVIRDIPVRLVTSGVGPLAAAYTAGRLAGEGCFTADRCRGLLSLGIAGTYAANAAPVGSVVMATREIWPEYGLFTEEGVDAEALGFPLAGKKGDSGAVWNSLTLSPAAALATMGLKDPATAPRSGENPVVAAGPSITVAAVSGTRTRARELAARHAALIENMESFPLALAAAQAGVPFAEVRSVSNLVGDRSPEAWNIPASLAALARAVGLMFSL
ncbi:Futalosine nucleosidase [uncultured delta proteobacterium]|uniref:Futalosine hydrolase n=1 Tax=uncultured delta proteobacterium TaxID=34034 RepID=A0A212JVD7_9DELT|nr:Futalosine nucleosidase [uncultured delta proteobacterium]